MFRKLCMLIAVSLAILGAVFAPSAGAQGAPTCAGALIPGPIGDPPAPTPEPTPAATDDAGPEADTEVDTEDTADDTADDTGDLVGVSNVESIFVTRGCADAIAYPGPFTNSPASPTNPFAAPMGIAAPVPASETPIVVTPATGRDLAHSGSEIVVLGYLGTGLLAFGAVALGLRRGGFVE